HAARDPAAQRGGADQDRRRVDRHRRVGPAGDHRRPDLVRVLAGRRHPVDPARARRHQLSGPGPDADRVGRQPLAQCRLFDAGLDRRLFLAAVRARLEEAGVSAVQARPLAGDKLIVVPYRKVSAAAMATNLVLILLGCFFLLPMLWMVFASIDSNPDWAIRIPSPTLANFADVLGRADALSSFRSSLILAGTTTVLTTLLALLSAYPLSRMHIPFK